MLDWVRKKLFGYTLHEWAEMAGVGGNCAKSSVGSSIAFYRMKKRLRRYQFDSIYYKPIKDLPKAEIIERMRRMAKRHQQQGALVYLLEE